MPDNDYGCGSRDYLRRSRELLDSGCSEALFHAAFELRCGIESRMQEYLEVAADFSKKRKQGWRIAELGKNIERAFKLADKIVQLTFHGTEGKAVKIYHTPVQAQLRKQAQQLGDYLHAMKRYRGSEDPWWISFKCLLDETCEGLAVATRGTLLGPLLIGPDGKSTKINHELEIDAEADEMMIAFGREGNVINVTIAYLAHFPS